VGNYRPITDVWLLARPKVKYYGAYPAGFLERARALLGVSLEDPVLHVCSGRVNDYPYRGGVGPNDKTLDLCSELSPDYCRDAREPLPLRDSGKPWPAILADPPYTVGDAEHYAVGGEVLPEPNALLRNALSVVRPYGRVGMLHYFAPRPPKEVKLIALIAVMTGYKNRVRLYSVFENRIAAQAAQPLLPLM